MTLDALAMTSPEVVDQEKKSSGLVSKAKQVLTTVFLMALTGAVGYGVGRLQARSQVKATQTAQAETVTELEKRATAAEEAVEAAEARSQLNEVRFLLLQSVDELNARNFGTANTHLRLASETINQVSLSSDNEKLESIKEELAVEEVNFATNPTEERRKLLDYASQINQLMPQ